MQRARGLKVAASHAVGERIDGFVVSHHRRRLRKIGWEHALDAAGLGYARGAAPPAEGNELELLVDGAAMLPAVADALQGAESHVHLAGWFFSPELDLTRGEDPLILRNLLADLAQRVDVRVLGWSGAPLPLFRPSKGDVNRMVDRLTRSTAIQCVADSCVRLMHCHHEKVIVIDDRVAFVGGIDLTVDGGDPFDTPLHRARGRVGWHDASVRIEGPAVAAVAEHFRMRWHGPTGVVLPPVQPTPARGATELQVVRTIPEHVYAVLDNGDFSILESYCRALRSAEKLVYLENQFLWSPEIVRILVDKLHDPPADDFRVVALLPARPNDGADVSRGQVAALIEADDGNGRFLACTIYARHGDVRDLIYVHAKIGIVDDRWFTIGSANLNEHSLFNDSELNVVSLDPALARTARLELWAEHLETDANAIDRDSTEIVDELWIPTADEQLQRIRAGSPLSHRLVKLPGVSRRRARASGAIQSRIYDA
jgi:phosphatidylserine/phosphatidylglycerophosphate/cardiolipin synthase-like enzyme